MGCGIMRLIAVARLNISRSVRIHISRHEVMIAPTGNAIASGQLDDTQSQRNESGSPPPIVTRENAFRTKHNYVETRSWTARSYPIRRKVATD